MFSRIPFVSARQFKRTASPFDNPLLLCDDSERVTSNKVHTIPFARAKQRIDVVFHAMLNSFNAIFFRDVAVSTTKPCCLWEKYCVEDDRTGNS